MILDALVKSTKRRIKAAQKKTPLDDIKVRAQARAEISIESGTLRFEAALKGKGISFICEIKRASPSKGVISSNFSHRKIATDYSNAGAEAISVLTEPEYFKGDNLYLKEIKQLVDIPILRKDFIIDEYQIYESKLLGADAILIICALHNKETIKNYIDICDSLGLSHLVEAHNRDEIELALRAGARVIGVNNRNLRNFKVDLNKCIELRELVPKDRIYIAESGIFTRGDIKALEEVQVDGVLVGEALMKRENKKAMLSYLRGHAGDYVEGEDYA